MSPYSIIQENKKKAEKLTMIGIWLMVIGFGVFIAIIWFGSTKPLLTLLAMLGLLSSIVGIRVSLNGHNLKKSTERIFGVLILADTRYKKMKEDSVSTTYSNTIKQLFREGQQNG